MTFADHRGLAFTADNGEAVRAFAALTTAYLGMRTDIENRLTDVFARDPDMAMAHVVKGCFLMLACNRKFDAAVDDCVRQAQASIMARDATARERAHVAALGAWRTGDMAAAEGRWQDILIEHPLDILALRLAHYMHIYFGDARLMRDAAARVAHAWDEAVPDYGFYLGIRAFGHEEAGEYAKANVLARRALAIDAADIWAMHALAHVHEMRDRPREGIAAVGEFEAGWTTCNHFAYHVWWHRCLYHVALEEFDVALALYDSHVRGDQTDDYLDIANGVALLARLELGGVDVGARWRELAEKCAARTRDNLLVFVDAHYLWALARDGRAEAADLLAAIEEAARAGTTEAAVYADVGLALGRAIAAFAAGEFDAAVRHLAPARYGVWRIGGSRAQRDLFHQLLITAALEAGRYKEARALLAERGQERPRNAWNWRRLASAIAGLGDDAGAARARAEAARLSGP